MSEIVHSKIQKWGNGLALRVAGLIRDIPKFEKDTDVVVEIFSDGFTVKKVKPKASLFPYSEAELLADITPETAHTDDLAECLPEEYEV